MESSALLPIVDKLKLMEKAHNIKDQIVTNGVPDKHFHANTQDNDRPHGPFPRHQKSGNHRERIHDRIQYAIAYIPLRKSLLSVMFNDHRSILKNFPSGLYTYC